MQLDIGSDLKTTLLPDSCMLPKRASPEPDRPKLLGGCCGCGELEWLPLQLATGESADLRPSRNGDLGRGELAGCRLVACGEAARGCRTSWLMVAVWKPAPRTGDAVFPGAMGFISGVPPPAAEAGPKLPAMCRAR